jgi:hypothetical protein
VSYNEGTSIWLTPDEREAIAEWFPRVIVAAHAKPDSPLASALYKVCPLVLPFKIREALKPKPILCTCPPGWHEEDMDERTDPSMPELHYFEDTWCEKGCDWGVHHLERK